MSTETKTYTLIDTVDDTRINCEFVEHIPYEPSAYHWDEGVIVSPVNTENLYFLSFMNGFIYEGELHDSDQLTRRVDTIRCPELEELIETQRKRDQELEEAMEAAGWDS